MRFMVGVEFRRGLRALHHFGLTYDLLIHPPQLPAAVELARLMPEQPYVLDHLAKPAIKEQRLGAAARTLAGRSYRPGRSG